MASGRPGRRCSEYLILGGQTGVLGHSKAKNSHSPRRTVSGGCERILQYGRNYSAEGDLFLFVVSNALLLKKKGVRIVCLCDSIPGGMFRTRVISKVV